MDNMLSMMEKYANNLEEIVQQRTSELVEEKKKTDMLLYSMLPRYQYNNNIFLFLYDGICKLSRAL